jgi:hypothetical protein
MEAFLSFLSLLIIGLLVYGLVRLVVALDRRLRRPPLPAYVREVAARLNARWNGSDLTYQISGREARLRLPSLDPTGRLVVEVDLRGLSPGALKIVSRGWEGAVAERYRARDCRTGDREFDERYLILASPESLGHDLFSPDRRPRLVSAIRSIGRMGLPAIDLARECLRVAVQGSIQDETMVGEFLHAAEEVTRALLSVRPEEGIRWMGQTEEPGGLCQVCGSAMTDRIVRCAQCATPHHEECWTYAGRCSTYACPETSYH